MLLDKTEVKHVVPMPSNPAAVVKIQTAWKLDKDKRKMHHRELTKQAEKPYVSKKYRGKKRGMGFPK